MPRPARWLSLISTASESESRWLNPPPARTAAFSSARSPGSVLRVSRMRALPSRGAHVAAGQRRDARAVRQEVQRDALAAEDRPQRARRPSPSVVPGVDRVAVAQRATSTPTVGVDLAEHLGRGRGAGEHALARARRTRPIAVCVLVDARDRRDVAEQAEVLGERARDERRARPARGGSKSLMRSLLDAQRRERDEARRGRALDARTGRSQRVDGVGEVGAGVRAARLLARRARPRRSRARHAQQVDDLVASRRSRAAARRRAPRGRRASRPRARRPVGVAHDTAVGRHRALHRAAQLVGIAGVVRSGSTTGSASGSPRRRGRARRSSRRSARARPCRRRSPRRHARPNTSPSSSEFDASRLAPCTPLHAASPHAQRSGQRRRAVEVGDDAAREVVRGGRDRQPVRASGRGRRSGTRAQIVGKRAREVVDHRGVEPEVVGAGRAHALVDRARDDVARREVGERVHVGHERDAVARRGAPRPRRAAPPRAAAAASTGGAARSGGTARTRGRRTRRRPRSASAMPSPVDSVGLVVTAKHWPDAAGREHDVVRARTNSTLAVGPQRDARRRTGRPRRAARSRTSPRAPRSAPRSTAATSARSISAPVASPPACTTRASEWPPSRASSELRSPSPVAVSNAAPSAASSRTRSGPSVTSTRTASASHRPAPAASVSARWSSGESGSVERGGDAALRVAGRRVRQLALGEHDAPTALAGRRGARS